MSAKITLVSVAIGVTILISACERHALAVVQAPTPARLTVTVAVRGYYYPEVEVNYHPETRAYWWHGGGGWISGLQPPSIFVQRIVAMNGRCLGVVNTP